MYAGNYGYVNNAPGSSPYNGGAPHPGSQNSVMQPGSAPNQMMYNAQQFPMAGGQSFSGNPGMMPTVGPGGMMQSAAMPHMAANGQMPNYQPPYSNASYGSGIPTSAPPQMNMPPNYGMGGGMPMGGFPMQQGMNPQQQQQMMQRMQASQQNANISTPTQRNFPTQPSQRTPTPNNGQVPQQSQHAGPQNSQGAQGGHTPSSTAQQQAPSQVATSNSISTPQTPTFPTPTQGGNTNGTPTASTPLSPGADPRDKERFSLILEINNELLAESINVQSTQIIMKKERAAVNGADGQLSDGEKKPTDDELLSQDYVQCMRRLQSNLTYLAAIADKKGNQVPAPLFLKAPPLNTSVKLRQPAVPEGTDSKIEMPDREETVKFMGELYRKLQALYPGVDPNKEPTVPPGSGAGRPGVPGPGPASGTQTPSQASPVPMKQKTPVMANSVPPHATMAAVSAP